MKEQTCEVGPWLVKTTESHILEALGDERQQFESELCLPASPEMLFSENSLSLSLGQEAGARIEFCAIDALKLVDKSKIHIQVPAAKVWSKAHSQKYSVPKPFDWTYSTTYDGTLIGNWSVQSTLDGLDQEFIRSRDPILLFGNIDLFEDELGDNGISLLNVKIRVMPTGFFVLQRFFLRVDGCLLRLWDTRLQWRLGDNLYQRHLIPQYFADCYPVIFEEAKVNFPQLYVLRQVRRVDNETWVPAMIGVQADDAEQHCKNVVEIRTEKLFPRDLL